MSGIIRTFLLIAVLTSLLIALGWYVGGEDGAVYAFGAAFIFNFFSYIFCGKLALRFYKAKKIDQNEMPKIYIIVAKLALAAGIPMPKLYLFHSDQPNAFATGRNPKNGAIAISYSLLETLNDDEIEAVLAHEMAHIKNRDTLIMTITATIAGAIGLLSNFIYILIGRNDRGEKNPVASLIIFLLAPITSVIVQMCISRTREFEADRVGAEICQKPLSLAYALYKLQNGADTFYNIPAERNPGTAHMFIINPLKGNFIQSIFSTHPKAIKRIDRLVAIHEAKFGPLPKDQAYFSELNHRKLPWYKRIFTKKPK